MKHCPVSVLKIFLQIGEERLGQRWKARRTVIFHRDVHRSQHPVGNIRRSRDKQKISTWHCLPRLINWGVCRSGCGAAADDPESPRGDGQLTMNHTATRKPCSPTSIRRRSRRWLPARCLIRALQDEPSAPSSPSADQRLDHRARQGGAADGGGGGSRARRSRPGTRRRTRRRCRSHGPPPHPSIAVVVGDHPGAGRRLAGCRRRARSPRATGSGRRRRLGAALRRHDQPDRRTAAGHCRPRAHGPLHAAASIGPRHQGDEPRAKAFHAMGRAAGSRAASATPPRAAATSSRM